MYCNRPRPDRSRRPLIATFALLWATCAACAMDDLDQGLDDAALRTLSSEAIYGNDDRQEVYAHPDATLRGLAQSAVVALVYPDRINASNPNNIRLTGPTLGQSYNLCAGQRFRDQIAAASCSGTLIDDDLVLTAGHCATSLADCQSKRFVFRDYYSGAGTLETITSQDVFSCQRVVVRSNNPDYAIIQLNRAATPRFTPAPVKPGDTAMSSGQPVGIIGFGSGIPAKIDNGGAVISPRATARDYFVATTDSFGGNSGSGVFDASGQVVGILVSGATDYVPTSSGCWVAATYPNSGSGGGENVVYVQRAIQALCASGWPSLRLCGGGTPPPEAWCQSCGTATPCPTGWNCFSWSGSSVSFCSKRCASNADCRSDHICDAAGDCIPTRENVCSTGDVWSRDACGRNIRMEQDCAANQTCQSATCVNTCTNQCTAGARRCVTGGYQVCGAGSSGCTEWGATQSCGVGETCSGAGLCTSNAGAWCQPCATQACPTSPVPWACFQWSGTSATFCARPCASEADCRADHSCVNTGSGLYCAPNVGGVCQGGDVYAQDACGNNLGMEQDCTATQTCDNGQCLNTCTSTCTAGARRCVTGGFQQCALNSQGCYTWSATQACPAGEACSGGGQCVAPNAWCNSCNRSSDCPSGWGCFFWRDTNISFCSKPCGSDADCRADHRCDADGDCIPRRANGCYSGDVWDVDTCGNPVYPVAACAAGQVCQGAACVTGCADQCALGARRCVSGGGFQACEPGAGGCAVWGATQSCGAGQTCQGAGTCAGSEVAWCQQCQSRSDCPTGWSCYAWQGSGDAGWCSKPCISNADCRADHTCDTGVCLPNQSDGCSGGDAWRVDACGNNVSLIADCGAGACEAGACVSTPTDTASGGDTAPEDTTATSEDTTSTGEDTTAISEDTTATADTGAAEDTTPTPDTSAPTPDTSGATANTDINEGVVSQGATDDCACQVRASQPTSGAGGRALPWLVGLVGALALRRRRGTRQAARRLSAKFLA